MSTFARKTDIHLFKNPIFYAFLIPLLYWTYLLFAAQMTINYDSIGYEDAGRLLVDKGWIEYFKPGTEPGPRREPVYPFLISLAMRMADTFSFSYQKVQTVFQILILGLTQFLSLKILNRLNIKKAWCALAVFYIGISPALVNSAFSLYSEIAVYPFLLGIVLFATAAWQILQKEIPVYRIFFYATGFAVCFVLSTFTKAIFELMFPVFLTPFIIFSFRSFLRRNFSVFKNSLIFLVVPLVIFYSAICGYKWLNKKYNGEFVLTNRGSWAFYGNTDRRMQHLSFKRFLAALAYVPGEGVCQKLFSKRECTFWSFVESDNRGLAKLDEFKQKGIDKNKINEELIGLSLQKIAQNPAQYFLLMGLECLKMFFWESTQIGWVIYPGWLERLFGLGPFKDGLRLGMFLLTFIAIVYAITFCWHNRRALTEVSSQGHQEINALFFILFFLFLYIGLHSFFFTLTRYSLPIAPLFIILIIFSINKLGRKSLN